MNKPLKTLYQVVAEHRRRTAQAAEPSKDEAEYWRSMADTLRRENVRHLETIRELHTKIAELKKAREVDKKRFLTLLQHATTPPYLPDTQKLLVRIADLEAALAGVV